METVKLIGAEALDESAQFALNEATLIVQNYLSESIIDGSLLTTVNLSFGNLFDAEKLENLRRQWATGNFEALPVIEIRPAAEINGANGAFAAVTNTIYLSQEYITQNTSYPQAITNVLLEEIGHFVDAQINASDSPGDEGAIFSALVRGETLDEGRLQQLKAEDDTATITLNGKVIQVEQDITEITSTVEVPNYAGDIGVYYDPSDQRIGDYDPAKERPPGLEKAPDLSPSEVNEIEFGNIVVFEGTVLNAGVRERLNNFLEALLFGPQTKALWELYFDSSPTYRADRQFFYDGSEIAKGFIESSETKDFVENFVNAALVILVDKIESSSEQDFKTSWNIDELLLPDYYLNPNYNFDKNENNGSGRWEDRDNVGITLPQNYKGLSYEPSATNIPGLIAGGVGYGGNAIKLENLIPDTRKLEGTIDLIKINDFVYQLNPKLKITVEDTIDFSPGNLGDWKARLLTEKLW